MTETTSIPSGPREPIATGVLGFVGTGAMGASIASRLVGGRELLVNDHHRAATDELIRAGARFATPGEIAARCRVVFLCLPGPDQVEDLLFGRGGLADALEPGSVVVDTTTGTPARDESIVAQLAERAVSYVDAPIAGGVRRAREGTATLMVGAAPEVFAVVEPLLREITTGAVHVGPVGAGHAMKLVNNLLNACNRFAALEAVRLGVAAGMSQDVVVDLLNRGSGRNYATEYTFPQLLGGEEWLPQGFTVELMLKDVRLALELAEAVGHETPVGDLARQLTQHAVERFGGEADQSQMMAEWYRR